MFSGWVFSLVSLRLAIHVGVGFPLRVYDGAAPTTFNKGCCHIAMYIENPTQFTKCQGTKKSNYSVG